MMNLNLVIECLKRIYRINLRFSIISSYLTNPRKLFSGEGFAIHLIPKVLLCSQEWIFQCEIPSTHLVLMHVQIDLTL